MGAQTMTTWAKRNVFEKVGQLLRSPNIVKPAWYDAAVLVPPPRKPFSAPKPRRIVYKEDKLLQSFFQRVGSDSFKYMHLAGANKDGPAVAFVNQQMKLMESENITARIAFARVMAKAEMQSELMDTAIMLASDEDMILKPMDAAEMTATINQHVDDIATHVTEVFVNNLMKDQRMSKADAEQQAVKQMKFESRNMYERLRKVYANDQYGSRGQQQQRGRFSAPKRPNNRAQVGKGSPNPPNTRAQTDQTPTAAKKD